MPLFQDVPRCSVQLRDVSLVAPSWSVMLLTIPLRNAAHDCSLLPSCRAQAALLASRIGPMRPRRLHGLAWLVLGAWACHVLALLPAPWAAPRTKRLAAAALEKFTTRFLDALRELKPIQNQRLSLQTYLPQSLS